MAYASIGIYSPIGERADYPIRAIYTFPIELLPGGGMMCPYNGASHLDLAW
jgi:hypothetical protein